MRIPTGSPPAEAVKRYVVQDGERYDDADAWVTQHADWWPAEWQHDLHGDVRYSWRRWYRPVPALADASPASAMYALRDVRADAMEYATT